MKYKLVIFDLDGTILNTLEDLCASTNAALTEFGLPFITIEQTRNYIGNGIKNLILQASKYHQQADEILAYFKEYYQSHFNDFTKEYGGIREVFKYCKNHQILIGVLTNKVEEIAIQLVETHFPDTMDFIFGEVQNRERKPNPTFLLSILEQYGLRKEEVLYVGDSEVDIKTCKNAGIEGVFVSYGFRDQCVLEKLTHRFVDSPLKLIDYLGE